MPQYIVKNQTGNFDYDKQPSDFTVLSALENRFFICEASTTPVGEFVVEFPEEQQAQFIYYLYPDGKKLWFDPFGGLVAFGDEVDSKNRRQIQYSLEQLDTKLAIMKWLALNVWIPDKQRMYNVSDVDTAAYIAKVNALTDADAARTFINKNLYYNL